MSLIVSNKYVVISQGRRSLISRIFAAALFTAMLYSIFQMVIEYYDVGYINLLFVYLTFLFLIFGCAFSFSSNFVFDFKKHRFREEVQISIFHFGWWEPMPGLEYVSIYNDRDDKYILKIFTTINDGYIVGAFKDADDGIIAAKEIAKKLEIDVWDATIRGDGKLYKKEKDYSL